MTGEKFTLMQYSVSAILGLIDAEDFVIPEIQRPFVWKRSQVRDLIDSLYNGYPTGYIITWKNPDVKTKDGGKANGKKVLIDGQQRVTALMAAIAGKEVLDDDFNKDRIKIAFNPLAEDETKCFAVQDASHLKDKRWIPDISVVFDTEFDSFDFAMQYCEVNESIKAYGVASHRHTPEIEEQLGYASSSKVLLNFTPHLIPMNRGILITAYASLKKGVSEEDVKKAYDIYKDEYFVRVLKEGNVPEVRNVKCSNFVDVAYKVDPRTHRVIMMGAMDNLVKGAAGQAIQNMNIMFGLDEKTGLMLAPAVL